MRILMIGGTKLTGPYVIRELLAAGCEVFVLSRTGCPAFCETAMRGDRRDTGVLDAAIEAAVPDVVIDMVPFTVGDANGLVRGLSTTRRRVPVVACSSCDVYAAYGRIHGTEVAPEQLCPISEDAALRSAFGPEGASYDKTGIERAYAEALDDLTVLRLPVIYGWPDATRIAPFLDPMLDGNRSIALPEGRRDFRISRTLHRNAAHAVALAALSGAGGRRAFNVAEPEAPTEQEWAPMIARACGWRGDFEIVPGPGPVQDLVISSSRIRGELGYAEIADPEEGLSDAVAFHAWSRRSIVYEKGY